MDLLGPRLRQIRKASKKTQERVCLDGGITQAMVSALENGKGDPALSTLRKVAKGYGVPLAMLFSDEPPIPPPPPEPRKPTQLEIAIHLFEMGGDSEVPRDRIDVIKRALEADAHQLAVLRKQVDALFDDESVNDADSSSSS
jgi:transcriptional regulator with XRE-family HTH domain